MTARQPEISHRLEDGFVVAWDTNEVRSKLRRDLQEAVDDQLEKLDISLSASLEGPARRDRLRNP